MIFPKKICQEKLDTWLKAEDAVATGQSYVIGNRSLSRANLKQIREQIGYWSARLAEAEAAEKSHGRNRLYRFTPRDV